jgi:DNA modification methylase
MPTPQTPWANRIVSHSEEPPDKLIANDSNWRTHTQTQRHALASVLNEVGLVQSVVVNTTTGRLVDGHLRVELAKAQGQPTIPVVYVELTEDEERLVLATLDPIGAMATADREKLGELLQGIDNPDLGGLLEAVARATRLALDFGIAGLSDPDTVPEPPAEPISKSGDLWLLGDHRLLCGDSTTPEDVRRLMAGERATLMATDPPYLVDYDGGNRPQTWAADGRPISSEQKTRHWDDYIDHDTSVAFYADFLRAALDEALTDAPVIYQWFAMTRADIVMAAWRANGLLTHEVIIWHKSRAVLGRSDFMYDYEPAMYGWVQGKRPEPERRPPANATAVWEVASRLEEGDGGGEHPTSKPTELIRRPIEWHTRPGDLIYEAFSGSGCAIIAAQMSGRRCYAVELSPAFVDVAVTRWEAFTGKQATLEGDGRSFAEVAAARTEPQTREPKGG